MIIFFFLKYAFQAVSPPIWGGHPQFKVQINMTDRTTSIPSWNFNYYYDSTLKVQRYEHSAPQEDQMCLMAPGKNKTGPCNIIFADDGWAYIQYPQEKYCCKCTKSFGYIKPDWLMQNSTFEGVEMINGIQVQHWTKWGNYLNHYYSSNDANAFPIRFWEYKGTKLKQWDFNLTSYVIGPNSKQLFDPPCQTSCGGRCRLLEQ